VLGHPLLIFTIVIIVIQYLAFRLLPLYDSLTYFDFDTLVSTCMHTKLHIYTYLKNTKLHRYIDTYIHTCLRYVTLRYNTLRYVTLCTYVHMYIRTYVHYITLHCVALHDMA
jgi:hypothetical protein